MIFDKLKEVETEEDFICFIKLLEEDYRNNTSEWQNKEISLFLDCAADWATESINGLKYYEKSTNPWRRCAEILYMGKVYE